MVIFFTQPKPAYDTTHTQLYFTKLAAKHRKHRKHNVDCFSVVELVLICITDQSSSPANKIINEKK